MTTTLPGTSASAAAKRLEERVAEAAAGGAEQRVEVGEHGIDRVRARR